MFFPSKLKPIITFSFFFIFLLIGIFLSTKPTSGQMTESHCVCPTLGDIGPKPCHDDLDCDNFCEETGEIQSGARCVTVGVPAPTPPRPSPPTPPTPPSPPPTRAAPSTQCNLVNPDCFNACKAGTRTSRFIPNCDCYCCGNCGFNDIVNIFINAADYLFGILGALALLFFIYGGVVWLIAGGSAEQIEKGKKILIGAVIGMALAFSAYLIIQLLQQALGVKPEYRLEKTGTNTTTLISPNNWSNQG